MELLALVSLLAMGSLFLGASYLAYRKDWKWPASACVLFAFVFFLSAHPTLREFVRTTAWATFVTYLEATAKGLADLGETIDGIRAGIERQQEQISSQHQDLAAIQSTIQETQRDLAAALADLGEQQAALAQTQEKLSDTEQLLKSFYESRTTRMQSTETDGTHFMAIEHDPQKVSVYVLLGDHVPIPQTLDLVWHVFSQPRNSYRILSNLVMFRWGQSVQSLRKHRLQLTYVPDPTAEPQYSELTRSGDRVYVDGQPVPWAFAELESAAGAPSPEAGKQPPEESGN